MNPKQLQTLVLLLVIGIAAVVIGLLPRHRNLTPALPTNGPASQRNDAPTPAATPGPSDLRVPTAPKAPTAPKNSTAANPSAGFRTRAQLLDHFGRHGRDFRARSPEEYLKLAQALRDASKGGLVLEVVRPS